MLGAEIQNIADENPGWLVISAPPELLLHPQEAALESDSEVTVVSGGTSTGTITLGLWSNVFEAEALDLVGQATPLRRHRLQEIRWRDRYLKLKHEIEYTVVLDGDLYVIEYEPLGIHAYARSLRQAEQDFLEEFGVLWDEFGLAPDEELAPSGIRLKRSLRSLVLRETPSQ